MRLEILILNEKTRYYETEIKIQHSKIEILIKKNESTDKWIKSFLCVSVILIILKYSYSF
jgi:hypothetical protein